jgi:hypothetical protein
MSTPISPLEQLEQQTQQPQSAPSAAPQSAVSPLEQLEQQTSQPTQKAAPVDTTHTERAMQMGMGGAPMFVDVPAGTKDQYEQAGQAGYQKGGVAGAAAVTGAGLAATTLPVISAAIEHLGGLTKIVQAAHAFGWTAFGLKEAHDLYKMVSGSNSK